MRYEPQGSDRYANTDPSVHFNHSDFRLGERVQTWWCRECGAEHEASVLGGLVVPPLEAPKLRSLIEVESERCEKLDRE